MNRLRGNLCYLAGPIDNAVDFGIEWRKDISHFLHINEIGVLNPMDRPTDLHHDELDVQKQIKSLKEEAKKAYFNKDKKQENYCYNQIELLMRPIIADDLAMVDRASFVILYIDKDIHMCGSYNEEAWASLQKKPIIIFCKQGKWEIPNFIFKRYGRHEMMFSSWEEVKKYILTVCYDKTYVDPTNTWKFFNYDKVYGYAAIPSRKFNS